jgi:hypothetical protein
LGDISTTGLRVATCLAAHTGQTLEVRFEGHEPLAARVAWARDGEIGLALAVGAIDLNIDEECSCAEEVCLGMHRWD